MSLKKLTFSQILIAVTIFLVLVIAALILLNFHSNPRIRHAEVQKGDQFDAEVYKQQIKLTFNRPIEQENIESHITINPVIDYKTSWVGNKLFLIFKNILQSNTEYTIHISKSVKDIYNENLKEDYEFKFKTKAVILSFIQRNYPEGEDKIIESNITLSEFTELYSSKNIKDFDKKDEFLAIVKEKDDGSDELIFYDSNPKKEKILFDQNVKVNQVKFSDRSNKLLILVQDVKIDHDFVAPTSGGRIFIYNYDEDKLEQLLIEDNITDIEAFEISQIDGTTLILKDAIGIIFYLVNIDSPKDTSPLGRHVATGGFNENGYEIVFSTIDFTNFEGVTYIDILNQNRETIDLTDKTISSLDPKFINNSEYIAYVEKFKDIPTTKGLYALKIVDKNNNLIKMIKEDGKSYELPQVSVDGRYIVMESFDENNLTDYTNQRLISQQPRPYKGNVVIYDRIEDKIIDNNVNGIEIVVE